MGFYRGANTVTDGLVFGFDTGYPLVSGNSDSYKFNKGEPTENEFPYPQLEEISDGTVGSATRTKVDFGGGRVGVRFVQQSTSDILTLPFPSYESTPVGGTTFTWSADVRANKATALIKAQVRVTVDGVNHWLTNSNTWTTSPYECNHIFRPTKTDEWHRIETTFTLPSGTTLTSFQLGTWYRATSNFTLDVANVQLEIKDHATPFTTGTRSNTNSLIDLKRATDIDLSDVSFDSNAQMVFDGTDDYIAITDILASESIGTGTKLTISLWLNCDSYGTRMPFSTGQTGNDRIYYWTENSKNTWRVGNYTSTTGHGTLPSVGTWFNTTLVIDGTNITGYLNGEEDYTGSYTGFTTANYATFGRHGASSSYYFDGKIATCKVYNRALTPEEIQQNFNAVRKRFNI